MAETNNTLDQVGVEPTRGVERKSLINSFPSTSLDLENRLPLGGPINSDPVTINGVEYGGFSAKYSPTEPYIQDGNQKSALVTVEPGGDVTDEGVLKVTALDIASNEAGTKQGGSGGPNRTNAENRLGTVGGDGTYTLQNASTSPLSPTPGGPALKNKEGQDITQTLNTYTPGNTYMENIIKFREEADNELI